MIVYNKALLGQYVLKCRRVGERERTHFRGVTRYRLFSEGSGS